MKKRILAMVLAGMMAFSMTACGSGGGDDKGSTTQDGGAADGADADGDAAGDDANGDAANGDDAADGGDDTAPATDMNIAMITDSGDITDQSFNQTTYETSKAWAEANSVPFTYYKPDSDSDEARSASVDQAVAGGANVLMMPGYMFAAAVVEKAKLYPDVKFVALDVGAGDLLEKGVGEGYDYNPENYDVKEYYNSDNVYCCKRPVHSFPYFNLPLTAKGLEVIAIWQFWIQVFALPFKNPEIPLL